MVEGLIQWCEDWGLIGAAIFSVLVGSAFAAAALAFILLTSYFQV